MILLQTQLSDEMITEAIAASQSTQAKVLTAGIAMLAFFVILMIVFSLLKSRRRRKDETKRSFGKSLVSMIAMVIPIIVFGGIFLVMFKAQDNLKTDSAHADEWHVVVSEITDLDEEEKTTRKKKKRNGRTYYEEYTDTCYYASVKDFSSPESISYSDYSSWETGDKVYVVVDYKGNIALLYPLDEYKYAGNRLQS